MAIKTFLNKLKRIPEYFPSFMKSIHSMFYYYLFLLLLGVIFFCSSLFVNYFTTPFTGDYTAQQFAFYTNGYDDWWHFFKTGEFVLYDQNTFLGADNIGSNSFYYLFDPFFLPILLCPRQLIPQGMAILTILKISASGMVFFLYMRYLGASRTASKITGIAYAFSGWMTWYLWFNHFTEVAIVFPLMLLGIEVVLKEKKPWLLAFAIALMGFVNYFFCICFVMCAFLYAMFRYFQRLKQNSWKDNLIILGFGFAAFLVGLLIPMMVVFPSAMHALTSPRASGANYLVYLKEAFKAKNFGKIIQLLTNWTATSSTNQNKARGLYPFIDFIFPVTSCRGTPLTVYGNETYDNVAGSYYCFLPMMMLLLPAFVESIKKKHFSVLVPLAFFVFALFTPCFYYLFHGFTQAYSRWTLFITTSILAYTGLYLDKLREKTIIPLVLGWGSLIILIVLGWVSANIIVSKYSENYTERLPIWIAGLIELVYVTAVCVTLCLIKTKKKANFYAVFTSILAIEIAAMGAFVIQGQGVEDYYYSNKGVVKNDVLHSLVEKTKKNDKSYYRSYSSLASGVASNDGMRNDYNGANFFHSIYNYNTADICNWSSITGGTSPSSWSGNYIQKRTNLDTLLGIKYYYVEDDYFNYQNRGPATSDSFRYNVPLDYIDVTDEYKNSEFRVYKNMNYIDFALTYDTIFETNGDPTQVESYEHLYHSSGSKNPLTIEELYMQGAIVNTHNNPNLLENIKENYSDITVMNPPSRSSTFYYRSLGIQKYPYDSAAATITYYDISSDGSGRNSLSLNASQYLELLNRDNDTFEKKGSPASGEFYRRYVAVIDSNTEYFPDYDSNGNIYYINASFGSGYDVDIYFVDINDKIVTYDNHNDGYYNSSRIGKEYRGFYIAPEYGVDEEGNLFVKQEAPKIKKIIIASRGNKMRTSFPVYIDTFTKWNSKMNNLKQYVLTDIKSSANTYEFKSNFDTNRVVVTRLAYEKGFKLKAVDEFGNKKDIDVFNGQGGFASFISEKGNWSYTLTFTTPYLQLSSYISMVGVFAFMSSLVAAWYFEIEREKKTIFHQIKK